MKTIIYVVKKKKNCKETHKVVSCLSKMTFYCSDLDI